MRRIGQSSTGQSSTACGSSSLQQVLGVFAVLILVGVGCRTGESWAPTLPKFGGSNLAFGSRSNADVPPPSKNFHPGENPPTAIAGRSPDRADLLANSNGQSRDPHRPPYSYDESVAATSPGNARGATSSNTLPSGGLSPNSLSLGGLPPATSPAASTLGTFPSNQSLASPVGFNAPAAPTSLPAATTPNSDLNVSLAGFNNSVANSPLLPAPSLQAGQHEVRGIPGGSLGNPLGGLPSLNNTHNSGLSGLPTLPPAPASGNSLPSTQLRNGLPPAPGLAAPGLAAPGLAGPTLPPLSSAPALSGNTSLDAFRPGTLGGVNPGTNNQSFSNPSFGASNLGEGIATGSAGMGSSPTQPVPPAPNYPQTQHGHYPGLPSWPESASGPSFSPANPAPDATRQNTPGTQTLPSTIPAPGGAVPGGAAPSSGGPSALPSFPGFSSTPAGNFSAGTDSDSRIAHRVTPGMICDGDGCYLQ